MAVAADYLEQFKALLPPGLAWTQEPDADLNNLLGGLAEEFARVDGRSGDLVEEADPRTTLELLADWERVAGLPDACIGDLDTIQARRDSLTTKLTAIGGQSPQYYIDLAAVLGYSVTITEYQPFQAGLSVAGDPAMGIPWRFAWKMTAPETTILDFRAGQSGAGEPLRSWSNDLLECAIEPLKPAHTNVLFAYAAAVTFGGETAVLGGEGVTFGEI